MLSSHTVLHPSRTIASLRATSALQSWTNTMQASDRSVTDLAW